MRSSREIHNSRSGERRNPLCFVHRIKLDSGFRRDDEIRGAGGCQARQPARRRVNQRDPAAYAAAHRPDRRNGGSAPPSHARRRPPPASRTGIVRVFRKFLQISFRPPVRLGTWKSPNQYSGRRRVAESNSQPESGTAKISAYNSTWLSARRDHLPARHVRRALRAGGRTGARTGATTRTSGS